MRITLICCLCLLLGGCGTEQPKPVSHSGSKPVAAADVEQVSVLAVAQPTKEDFLSQALAMNSAEHPVPKAEFRDGHVTSRTEGELPKLSKTEAGFSIQMPSAAPVPTPLAYKGRLYVSGGFSCKEFYCFDAETGAPIWAVDLDDDGPSAAVASDDTIIINTESCTIFALDAESGKLRWSHWLGDPLMSVPTIAGGRVFVVYPSDEQANHEQVADVHADEVAKADNGQVAGSDSVKKSSVEEKPSLATHVLACFDLKSGGVLWQKWIDTECMSAPVAVGDHLYLATVSGILYDFKQSDGQIVAAQGVRATSAPTIVGNQLFYTRRADVLDQKDVVAEAIVKQDLKTNADGYVAAARFAPYLDWRVQEQAESTGSAAGFEGTNSIGGGFGGGFFAVASDNNGHTTEDENEASDAETEKSADEKETPLAAGKKVSAMDEPPQDDLARTQRKAAEVIGQGNVSMLQSYHGSRLLNWGNQNYNCMGDLVLCTSAENGKVLWSIRLEGELEKVGGYLAAPPIAAGDQLFLSTLAGDVLQIAPESGKLQKTYKIGSPMRFPPSVEGGRIYVGTQDGKVVCVDTGNRSYTGWPMWGADAAHSSVRK